ncbi:MAG: lipoyl(octanoyl) transferase LipB [Thaumarchaeota archaeon]|nr:lipoyl(octanoyl) transferase LipB [Nitrososphaerota archaeon]
MSVSLLDLGRRPYPEVWELQKQLVEARSLGRVQDTLILVEHDHVVTLGRKTSAENLSRDLRIPVFQVERGGDATYHGPGQLVGYPITKMHVPDVKRFVWKLEQVLIDAVGAFSIKGGRKEGHPGVWVGDKKLASIGVAVTNWVTYHGFALNVNTDLEYFQLIRPCGLDPDTITSMERLAGSRFDFDSVKGQVIESFSRVFDVSISREAPGLSTVAPVHGKD